MRSSVLLVLATCFLVTALQENKLHFSAARRASAHKHTEHAASFAKLGIHLTPEDALPAKVIFGAKLGAGAFGVVFQGEWERKLWFNKKIAIKLVKQSNGQDENALIAAVTAEGSMLDTIKDCKFVLKVDTAFKCQKKDLPVAVQAEFADVAATGLLLGLVTNFAEGGELKDHWKSMSGKQRYSVMKDYATALKCIKGVGYVHRDVKPGNLMIKWNGNDPEGMVIDVGLMATHADAKARCLDTTGPKAGTSPGTPTYYPDQLLTQTEEACTQAVAHWDEFSLGKSFEEIGANDDMGKCGVKAKALRDSMKTIGAQDVNWDGHISEFGAGYSSLPVCDPDKFNVNKNSDAYRDSPYKLTSPGVGYFKNKAEDSTGCG